MCHCNKITTEKGHEQTSGFSSPHLDIILTLRHAFLILSMIFYGSLQNTATGIAQHNGHIDYSNTSSAPINFQLSGRVVFWLQHLQRIILALKVEQESLCILTLEMSCSDITQKLTKPKNHVTNLWKLTDTEMRNRHSFVFPNNFILGNCSRTSETSCVI